MTHAGPIPRTHPQFETLFRQRFEAIRAESDRFRGMSRAEEFFLLDEEERSAMLAELERELPAPYATMLYAWEFWARPKQFVERLPRPRARFLLWLSGRGFGKSKTATNWLRQRIEAGAKTLFIAGPTLADIGKYQIHGESGIMAAFPPHQRPIHKEDKRLIVFPHKPGVECHIITAEEPEWRGGNVDTGWCDEIAKWRYRDRLWNNIEMSSRSAESGLDVQIAITTTPLPVALLKEFVLDPDCLTILGSSDENASNLEGRTLARWSAKFGGTRLGRQEMGGEILTDNPGALFSKKRIEETRVDEAPGLVERAIAIDPGVGIRQDNDPTAMVAGGIDARGHIYVTAAIADRWTPEQWGSRAISFADEHKADATVLETNRDSDVIAANVRNAYRVAGRAVPKTRHDGRGGIVSAIARVSKDQRATPVQSMMDQGRIHFVGTHIDLENEITEWDPSLGGKSPNLLDAFVWLVWYLARLGEPERVDHAAEFDGLAAANESLARPARREREETVSPIDEDDEQPSRWDRAI